MTYVLNLLSNKSGAISNTYGFYQGKCYIHHGEFYPCHSGWMVDDKVKRYTTILRAQRAGDGLIDKCGYVAGYEIYQLDENDKALVYSSYEDCGMLDTQHSVKKRLSTPVQDAGVNDVKGANTIEDILLEEMLKELQAYKTAEEQGLLQRFPCKIGDTVYLFKNELCRVMEAQVLWFECHPNGVLAYLSTHGDVDIRRFGETVFLSKEDAESKLKELRKSNEER